MDLLDLAPYFGALLALVVGGLGLSALRDTVRGRRRQNRLARRGRVAAGRVTAVEAMDRSLNNAAGHPVSVELTEGAERGRALRDTTGLGGYLVREGTGVSVRYVPDDPDLARVEEIHGPHGTYPTRPRPSALAGLVGFAWPIGLMSVPVVVALVLVGVFYFRPLIAAAPAAFALLGLAMVVGAVARGAHESRGRGRGEEAFGSVTDRWEVTSQVAERPPRTFHPFTVHFVASDGREVHAHSPDASEVFAPDIHQRVRVRYDTARPARFQVVELGWERGTGFAVPLGAGLLFMVVGSVFTVALLAVASTMPP